MKEYDLHSNMVRFIISYCAQYGLKSSNLHSNMVRFIINSYAGITTK